MVYIHILIYTINCLLKLAPSGLHVMNFQNDLHLCIWCLDPPPPQTFWKLKFVRLAYNYVMYLISNFSVWESWNKYMSTQKHQTQDFYLVYLHFRSRFLFNLKYSFWYGVFIYFSILFWDVNTISIHPVSPMTSQLNGPLFIGLFSLGIEVGL